MKKIRIIQIVLAVVLIAALTGVIWYIASPENISETRNQMGKGMGMNSQESVEVTSNKNSDGTYDLNLDNTKWKYDEENEIYYQIGVVYCANPETTDYETLGIYVPANYFDAVDNGDGTYTCTVNADGEVGDYSASSAPIVIPVNTPGYSAQHSPSSYSSSEISDYTSKGIIYVYAGCRGKYENSDTDYNSGAPWGVTDLKAAIRYVRYNASSIPADTEKIFTFGMSGGGAQSAIVGATGDSDLYTDYLESIGAAMTDAEGNEISDAVYGSMCWCPITNLDVADAAYEWNMGQFSSSGTREDGSFTAALSDDLAEAYAEYINALGLTDADGNKLTLEESSDGIYTSGSYYDYVLSVLSESLNNYLSDTYSSSSDAAAYVKSLDSEGSWVTYDESTGKATVTNLEGFVNSQKNATKDVGAFDDLNSSQAENSVFGNSNSNSLHFDSIMSKLLSGNDSEYSSLNGYDSSYKDSYSSDLSNEDALGKDVSYRSDMYNPMYYLCDYYDGSKTSTVAKYWRINTGVTQGDTANVTEINLALALESNEDVEDVDFTTVWAQGHTQAERTGTSTENFIAWIAECMNADN